MANVKFFSGEQIPLEMHKVRIVQKLNLPPVEERLKCIAQAGNNTFLLKNKDVYMDMLTDSGVNAMSDRQQAAMLVADDSYAGSATFTKLENKVGEIFGTKYFLPAHQGRACENIIAMTMEARQCTRHRAIKRNAPLLFLLSVPCALGFNLLSGITPLGEGSSIMDLEDFLVSNIALPLGSLAILVFCVSRRYWGWDNFLKEANAGRGLRFSNALRLYMAYILPAILLFVFIAGIVVKFFA